MTKSKNYSLFGSKWVTIVSSDEGALLACDYGDVDNDEKRIEVFSSNGKLSLCSFSRNRCEYRLYGGNPNQYHVIVCDNRIDHNSINNVYSTYDYTYMLSEVLQMKYGMIISHNYKLVGKRMGNNYYPSTFTTENYDISIDDDGFLCIDSIKYTVCNKTLNFCRLGGKYLKLMIYRLFIERERLVNEIVYNNECTSSLKSSRFI